MVRLTAGNVIKVRENPSRMVGWSVNDAAIVFALTHLLSLVVAPVVLVAAGIESGQDVPFRVLMIAGVAIWVGYGGGSWWVSRAKGQGITSDFGVRCSVAEFAVGALLGGFVQVVVLPLLYYPISYFVSTDPSQQAKELVDSVSGVGDWALFVVAVVVVAPLVEELYFRGLLLRSVEYRFGRWVAVVASSAIFALVHLNPILLPGLFVLGVIAACLTLWTGRLGSALSLHVGFNLTTVIILGW